MGPARTNRPRQHPSWLLVSTIVCAALLAGCARREMPLRIGINAWPGNEFLFLAQEKGFFVAQGVDVRLIEYSSLGDVRRAFDRGQIDGMTGTVVEILQSRDATLRAPRAFMVTDISNGADMILARGSITAVSELAGKRVAAEPESLGMFVLARALARHGMPFSAVAVVATDQTDMAKNLDSGWVDAAVTYPPVSFEIMQIPGTRVVFSSADIPGEVVDVVALAGDVLERRLDDAARIVRAWDQSLAYAAAHPAEARELMASRERLSVEEFGEALAGITLLGSDAQRPLFEPGGPLARAIGATAETLRDAAQIRDGSTSSECLAPEPLARARG